MAVTKPWRMVPWVLVLGLTAVQCRTGADGSKPAFGWEEDLTLPPAPAPAPAPKPPSPPKLDDKFCRGEEAGRCFTLILRIPTPDMVSDLGLSVLGMAQKSPVMMGLMAEACQAAWSDYRDRYKTALTSPLRMTFVNRVRKVRCVLQTLSEESIVETAPLLANEMGLSVRLTKFDISARTTKLSAGGLNIVSNETAVETQFRSASVRGSHGTSGDTPSWQTLKALNLTPVVTRQSFGGAVTWQLDPAALSTALSQVDTSQVKDQADQMVKSFVDKSKAVLSSMTSANALLQTPLLLIGLGFEAYKAMCGSDSSRCAKTASTTPLTPELKPDQVPTSELYEALRMAIIRSVQGVLDKTFESADKTTLSAAFHLN